MREPEQFVVPALGVLVLLAVFILGSAGFYSIAYLIILGLLGLAAVGTYFPPPAVQVELRIVIAGLGLLVLIFMFSSLGFWLALIGFGAIGALQIRHRSVLRPQLHTVDWLKTMQSNQAATGATGATITALPPDTEGTAAESGAVAPTVQPTAPAQAVAAGGSSSVNIGGIGAAVLGVIVLLSFLLPWLTVSASALGGLFGGGGEASLSGWQMVREATRIAGDADEPALYAIPLVAVIIAGLAILGIASVALPRGVPLTAGIAGLVIMVLLAIGFFAILADIRSSDLGSAMEMGSALGMSVNISLGMGFWLASLAFLLMAGLQLIVKQRA